MTLNKITIFTPAYNRAYTLQRLYESIKKQEYKNFEWISVDDGSKDNTKELIHSFISEKKVDIKYFFQENSGKHIAINKGVEEASGNLFSLLGSKLGQRSENLKSRRHTSEFSCCNGSISL